MSTFLPWMIRRFWKREATINWYIHGNLQSHQQSKKGEKGARDPPPTDSLCVKDKHMMQMWAWCMKGSIGVWDPCAQAELEQSVQCDPSRHFSLVKNHVKHVWLSHKFQCDLLNRNKKKILIYWKKTSEVTLRWKIIDNSSVSRITCYRLNCRVLCRHKSNLHLWRYCYYLKEKKLLLFRILILTLVSLTKISLLWTHGFIFLLSV